MTDSPPLIDIRQLSVAYRFDGQINQAVRSVSFQVASGETVAIVGESGSGKSTLANAILGLLPDNARITGGELQVDGHDLSHASEREKRRVRGSVIGLVPQDPMVSLNPTLRIGRQIAEALILANGRRYPAVDADVLELLQQVGLDKPVLRARQYPHELSGGMRQRVLIAIALAGNPRLIIADEPTSALDVTVQRKILDHLQRLVAERGISLLIITHDLGVAADRADRVLVMKSGELVEQGAPQHILINPAHAYTRALIAAAPAFGQRKSPAAPRAVSSNDTPLLTLSNIGKTYRLPYVKGEDADFQALQDVNVKVYPGQTLAIVGESGSGKSTALRIALGLEKPTCGRVLLEGRDVTDLGWREFRPLRRRIQLVQQNPFAALDPRFTLFESIVEPLVSFGLLKGRELEQAARQLIERVHLPVAYLDRLPRELSGGQRQRVAIARALALKPDLLLLDEPVSALDVSVQAQILDLLAELQAESGIAYVLVSHDLAVVASVAHQVLVLKQGKTIEQGLASDVFERPEAAYTQELIAAIPGRRLELQVAAQH
ncbi:ABC transporter ATP-binding protein [Pseudomonas syringae pv. actinidiae]|uniref:ABC-type dipeptide transporter n=5 Tax=Pseudomonas syringae TaxID=317 RepID=A0A2V0QC72_PSESF|nr:ABC transporter ATP-binding protein [Pseudomonas syringae]AKT30989.1 ABC transporter ATP-binding protein [Pseudomonas syringae pv. actinidiae ICMP 18884]AOE57388.1 ABC transporter ATP-binding protein [Pseudomonas syringae pv. actinidiae ICMP 18708]APP98345.1 ABC transporter ATP-binding protein [Pseudomonas syringae pv. actinidiae]APQ04102.1 ABC transporter ATP-binding protein [Pseudomonas syringae pv. actinidiae]AQL37825.1 ABC transporter ATP-binding protein [Pseudomonas syringae pv. actini